MLPCVIVDLIIERLSHRTSLPPCPSRSTQTAADITRSATTRSHRRVGKKEGRALIKTKLTCGSGQSRADDQELGLTWFGMLPPLPQPSFPRQEVGKERKIDLDATPLPFRPGSVSGFLVSSCLYCLRGPRAQHEIERTERERERQRPTHSYGGKHNSRVLPLSSTWRQSNIPRRSLPRWMGSLRQV